MDYDDETDIGIDLMIHKIEVNRVQCFEHYEAAIDEARRKYQDLLLVPPVSESVAELRECIMEFERERNKI